MARTAAGACIAKQALAAELGVHPSTIYHDALVAGIVAQEGGYTPAQADAIRAVRAAKTARVSAAAFARRLGLSEKVIRRRAPRLGFPRDRGLTPAQAAAIARADAISGAALARDLGADLSVVYAHARRLGFRGGRYQPRAAAAIRSSVAARRAQAAPPGVTPCPSA